MKGKYVIALQRKLNLLFFGVSGSIYHPLIFAWMQLF